MPPQRGPLEGSETCRAILIPASCSLETGKAIRSRLPALAAQQEAMLRLLSDLGAAHLSTASKSQTENLIFIVAN